MLKQDAIRNNVTNDIIQMIEDAGFTLVAYYPENIVSLSDGQINEFYAEHVGRDYYSALFDSIALGCRPLIVEYPKYDIHAWEKMRKLIGPTKARSADPKSIRGKFGGHLHDENAPMVANAIHASDSLASVRREIKIIFPENHFFSSSNHGQQYFHHLIET